MNDSANKDQLWDQITEDFREACLLRREGKREEADQILNEGLPPAIAQWSKANPTKSDQKRNELVSMFAEEQRRVDTALVVQRVISTKLTEQLVPSLCATVATEVKGVLQEQLAKLNSAMAEAALAGALRQRTEKPRRVRFDDIPGVIDAVLAEQQEAKLASAGTNFHRPQPGNNNTNKPPQRETCIPNSAQLLTQQP